MVATTAWSIPTKAAHAHGGSRTEGVEMMWLLAIALILVGSPACASHETFGPLALVLPRGSDRAGWQFTYTDTGYLMANHMPDNQRSLRHFEVPVSSIRAHPRPLTYSVKVFIRPDEKRLDPELGANAGLVFAADAREPKWKVVMVRADGDVVTGNLLPRENRGSGRMTDLWFFKGATEPGKATEIKVVEEEQTTVVFINGARLMSITGVAPRGSMGIVAGGAGDFHFRAFTVLDRNGQQLPGPSAAKPNVRR
jgi:hypothetical protein